MNDFRRYINILNEDEIDDNIFKTLKADCQPWFDSINGMIVYRGTRTAPNNTFFRREIRIDRKAKDMELIWKNTFDKLIAEKGLTANRSNSAFVSGDVSQAKRYGMPFVFLPVGKFNYTWSDTIKDAYDDIPTGKFVKFKDYDAELIKTANEIQEKIKKCKEDIKETEDLIRNTSYEGVIANLERDLIYFNNDLTRLNGPNIIDHMMAHKRNNWHEESVEIDYDAFKKKYFNSFYGDDGSLSDAIESHNEILIHAVAGYYVDIPTYNDFLMTI